MRPLFPLRQSISGSGAIGRTNRQRCHRKISIIFENTPAVPSEYSDDHVHHCVLHVQRSSHSDIVESSAQTSPPSSRIVRTRRPTELESEIVIHQPLDNGAISSITTDMSLGFSHNVE